MADEDNYIPEEAPEEIPEPTPAREQQGGLTDASREAIRGGVRNMRNPKAPEKVASKPEGANSQPPAAKPVNTPPSTSVGGKLGKGYRNLQTAKNIKENPQEAAKEAGKEYVKDVAKEQVKKQIEKQVAQKGFLGILGLSWEVFAIIAVILIIIAFILLIVGFIVGFFSGGNLSGSPSSSPIYSSDVSEPYISTDGKYFPLTIRPQNNFTKKSSRGFGDARSGGARHHAGVDLIAPAGTPIRSIADGTVVNYYYFYSGTYCMFVDYGDFVINYGEIARMAPGISVGSQVAAGQIIAYVGLLGSGQSMLHMEMYTSGTTHNSAWWDSMRPSNLLDPTNFVTELLAGFQ